MGREHLPQALAIEAASFHMPWVPEMFSFELEHADSVSLAALADGALAGYLVCRIIAGEEAELMRLAVPARIRRHGIGRALLDACVRVLTCRGVRVLHLEVRESNAAARAFYGSAGFRESGKRKSYYSEPAEDAILMSLELGSCGDAARIAERLRPEQKRGRA